jgi:gamma-glutamyltranspeptidase/glutathione hydrolase
LNNYFIILFAVILLSFSCNNNTTGFIPPKAMVVSAHPVASDVGIKILKKGGNAADATIAVQFALAVVYPSAGNIGGGGFFVYRSNSGNTSTLDFREKAPINAHRNMFLDSNNIVIDNLSLYSLKAVGVPGSVDGMIEIHKKYGNLKWEELVQPSIDLAESGFPLTKKESEKLNRFNSNHNGKEVYNPYYKNQFHEGDTLFLPDLAKTLKLIRDQKREGFYSGEVADKIIKEMKKNHGLISKQDLTSYKSVWRKPIIGNYKNYKIISMGPPSSGGILLVQMLKMAEFFPLKAYKFHSKEAIHIVSEIERRSFADRAEYLGDPDFYNVPTFKLLDTSYLKKRVNNINLKFATPSKSIYAGNWNQKESEETTHFSIVDQFGNAASVTTTLNGSFGSGLMVENAGFLLNNEMDDFSIQPGYPNMYGLIGGEANSIIPEKRMLSSMTPTILEKDGNLFMVIGTPGGSTIITAVFQTILNVTEFGMSIEESVNASRFHHQWYPDQIKLEKIISKDSFLVNELKSLNHKLNFVSSMNRVDAILLKNNLLFGGADRRGDDHVSFF